MLTRRQFLQAAPASAVLAQAPLLRAADSTLIVRGARVIDPAQKMDRVGDVAIRGGRIAAVHPEISSSAPDVIDAFEKIVTPGLIDIHCHVADPDLAPGDCLPTGVTSLVDGGSRGADNVDDLVAIARSAPNRVRIFLNIARTGIASGGKGELLDISAADVAAARRAIERQQQWIVGIKARLSRSVAGEHDLEAVRRARQAAEPFKLPLMLHIGDTFSPLPAILDLLRPGDIITHMYAPPPHGILDDNGKLLPQVREARRRGILFDVGNGRTGHFRWDVAERALQQDFLPDTISSDLNAAGRTDQVIDLPNVLSKFLLLGMPVEQVIARVTANAARAILDYKYYGTLRAGSAADMTVLELREGNFEFVDNYGGKRMGRQKLFIYAVVAGGKRI